MLGFASTPLALYAEAGREARNEAFGRFDALRCVLLAGLFVLSIKRGPSSKS